MFVRDVVLSPIESVSPQDSVAHACRRLEETGLTHLPVVEEGRLVGVVSRHLLSPFCRTPQAEGRKVAHLMAPPPLSVGLHTLVEEAAALMLGQEYNFLGVVDQQGKLTGIVTRDALFVELCHFLGLDETNTRFTVILRDQPGELARLAEVVRRHGGNITHLVLHPAWRARENPRLVMRVTVKAPGELARALAQEGFPVVDAINFANGRRIGSVQGLSALPPLEEGSQ
ncbi:MAG: CBS domain-containing protein [Clostridiales bacterium]|nr:CBS domain-containing protein [Clostridiales bacterium]